MCRVARLDAPKRCSKLRYGSLICTALFLLAMFAWMIFFSDEPQNHKMADVLFWSCNAPAFVMAFVGLYEVQQKRDTELKKFEAAAAFGFLYAAISIQVAYLIYLLVA
ncbi:MAG: hypothetical protein MR350_06915 [Alphaproteobacteria bacterium]|nr:hypothetical protein [Alphaproteobacteria bacterium]